MKIENLIFQIFIGKVSDIIGIAKTVELIEESKKEIEKKPNKIIK